MVNLEKSTFKKYFLRRPNIPQFIELMTSENEVLTKRLSILYFFKTFELKITLYYK